MSILMIVGVVGLLIGAVSMWQWYSGAHMWLTREQWLLAGIATLGVGAVALGYSFLFPGSA